MSRLDRFADEQHPSCVTAARGERLARRWHMGFVVCYSGLVFLYSGAIAFHLWAARRHRSGGK